jgi:integrase
MAREIHKLTPAMVAAATDPGRYADGGGLYLQVTPAGKSWLFRYVFAGKENWMGLGKVDIGRLAESLAAARGKAADGRSAIVAGKDPLAERRASEAPKTPAAVVTFREAAQDYLRLRSDDWKNKVHKQQWVYTLDRYVYPTIGNVPVNAVTVDHVQQILEPIWRTKSETARRIRGRIEMILDREAARGRRSLSDNPARQATVRQLLGKGKPRNKHHAALPYAELPDLMTKLEKRNDMPSLALQWLIVTAVRPTEAREVAWSELDLKNRLWVIPAARMKRDREHRVPLSLLALSVIERVAKRAGCPFVFAGPSGEPISDTAIRNVLRLLGVTKDTGSMHGMRSAFRDWAAESGVDDPVAEACLAHAVSDKVLAAYRRTTFFKARQDIMERWGLFLS